ncbi:MAG: YjbQ family protein [Chloroflexi bacterium]|nr:YjbQ family protein [Chloroflexota bacterium]
MLCTKRIEVATEGHCDIIDITSQVAEGVAASGLKEGTVMVFVAGSTAAVTTMEYEPGLLEDLKETWKRLVPEGIPYKHDLRWGDGNGYAHIRASLLGPFLGVPLVDGRMALGMWQQIVLVDFDNRPRSRAVVVQVVGD